VTTGQSSIQRVFSRWAQELSIDAELVGIDLPLHAEPQAYRRVVQFIAADELSRGALVTTHKLDLFESCRDLFDRVDPLAHLMQETSCLSKRGDDLVCHAKDPVSAGLALDAFLTPGRFREGAELLVLGAGGSALAITWHLHLPDRHDDVPRRTVITDLSSERLAGVHATFAALAGLETVRTTGTSAADELLGGLAEGSVVINATGLGKDRPGSPLSPRVVFPRDGVAWDLNYRGDLVFLEQARAQQESRHLQVEDGWVYFLHGWTRVVAEVFDVGIPTSGPVFDRLGEIAEGTR